MGSEKLNEYVDQARRAGYSDSKIRAILKKTGWNDDDIDNILASTKPSLTIDPPKPEGQAKELENPFAANTPQVNTTPPADDRKLNILALISLLLSLFFPLMPLILAIVALGQIKKKNERGKILAIIAIVLNAGLLIVLIFVVPIVLIFTIGMMNYQEPIIPERCMFPAGLECIYETKITPTETFFTIRNNLGKDIIIRDINSAHCTGEPYVNLVPDAPDPSAYSPAKDVTIPVNSQFTVKLTGCANGQPGANIKEEVTLSYTAEGSDIKKDVLGSITSKVASDS